MSEGGAAVAQPPKLYRNTLFHSGPRVKVIPLDTRVRMIETLYNFLAADRVDGYYFRAWG